MLLELAVLPVLEVAQARDDRYDYLRTLHVPHARHELGHVGQLPAKTTIIIVVQQLEVDVRAALVVVHDAVRVLDANRAVHVFGAQRAQCGRVVESVASIERTLLAGARMRGRERVEQDLFDSSSLDRLVRRDAASGALTHYLLGRVVVVGVLVWRLLPLAEETQVDAFGARLFAVRRALLLGPRRTLSLSSHHSRALSYSKRTLVHAQLNSLPL